jgi:hypothetical protein
MYIANGHIYFNTTFLKNIILKNGFCLVYIGSEFKKSAFYFWKWMFNKHQDRASVVTLAWIPVLSCVNMANMVRNGTANL